MSFGRIILRILTFMSAACALLTFVLMTFSPEKTEAVTRQDYKAIILEGTLAVLGLLADWLTREAAR